jgi:hypothetical protein
MDLSASCKFRKLVRKSCRELGVTVEEYYRLWDAVDEL